MARQTPEGKLKDRVKKYLDTLKPRVFHVKVLGGGAQASGMPDFFVCVRGQFVALELKAPDGKVEPLQQAILDWIALSGGKALVTANFEEVRWLFEKEYKIRFSQKVTG